MAMLQRDDTIEAFKRLDALLEYAVMHNDEDDAERLREELRKGRICVFHPCVLRLETTRTTGKNNFERGARANSPALFLSSAYRLRWIFDMIAPSQP